MLVSPPSSGKTEVLQALSDIRIGGNQTIWKISDITTNAFMSGMKRTGKETSLLMEIPFGGIFVFKDFTSLLSKRYEDQVQIFSQLREIYDREYEKHTGIGDELKWEGKAGAIGGSTEVIYLNMENISAMGDRFMMYEVNTPDREEVTSFVMKMRRGGLDKEQARKDTRLAVKDYIESIVSRIQKGDIVIFDQETEDSIVAIADFCTRVRSGVITDRHKSTVEFVPKREMPMRMLEQLLTLGTALFLMDKLEPGGADKPHIKANRLSDSDILILYKHAFDSISVKRRMALKYLGSYTKGVTTAGLATAIGYQTEVVRKWLAELNALGICTRVKTSGPQGDTWRLHDKYRPILIKLDKLKIIDSELTGEDAKELIKDGDFVTEALTEKQIMEQQAADEEFDAW
jgi:hypothetical protein